MISWCPHCPTFKTYFHVLLIIRISLSIYDLCFRFVPYTTIIQHPIMDLFWCHLHFFWDDEVCIRQVSSEIILLRDMIKGLRYIRKPYTTGEWFSEIYENRTIPTKICGGELDGKKSTIWRTNCKAQRTRISFSHLHLLIETTTRTFKSVRYRQSGSRQMFCRRWRLLETVSKMPHLRLAFEEKQPSFINHGNMWWLNEVRESFDLLCFPNTHTHTHTHTQNTIEFGQ